MPKTNKQYFPIGISPGAGYTMYPYSYLCGISQQSISLINFSVVALTCVISKVTQGFEEINIYIDSCIFNISYYPLSKIKFKCCLLI